MTIALLDIRSALAAVLPIAGIAKLCDLKASRETLSEPTSENHIGPSLRPPVGACSAISRASVSAHCLGELEQRGEPGGPGRVPRARSRPIVKEGSVRRLTTTVLRCLVVLAALAGPAGSASATPQRPHPQRPRAHPVPPPIYYGDSAALPAHPTVGGMLATLPPCVPSGLLQEPSFAAALADARALVRTGAGARGLRMLAADRFTGNPDRTEATAAGFVAAGSPAGALAALLDAQARASRDATSLINASALLSALGRPGDALAFVDRAAQIGGLSAQAFGVPERAIELNNRGLALLGLGRYSAAAAALESAVRLAGPVLSEAGVNLAQAFNCQHKRPAAFRALLAGSYRRRYDLVVSPPIEAPSASELGLTASGAPNALPKLTYPPTPADATGANEVFQALDQRDGKQEASLVSQITTLSAQLNAELQHASPITQRRTGNLLRLAVAYGGPTAGVIKFPAAVEAARQAEHDYTDQEFGPNSPLAATCRGVVGEAIRACLNHVCAPALDQAHSNWLVRMKALDGAARDAAVAYGRSAAPALANLTDPAHQLAKDYILHFDLALTSLLTGEAENWDANAADLYGPPGTGLGCQDESPTGLYGTAGSAGGGPGPCSSALAAHKLVINLVVAKLKVNCESVEASVDGPGLIAPFVSLKYAFYGKTVTIFAGAKVGNNFGPLSGSAKAGFYITGGVNGTQDFGVRGSISGTIVSVESGVSRNWSLAGAIAPTPTPFAGQ